MDVVERLIAHPPALHDDDAGNRVDYGVAPELLRYLGTAVQPGMRTLETGAGHSTLVFAARGAQHASVMPEPAVAERVREFAVELGVSCADVRFHLGPSERVLPVLEIDGLDLALVDGRHAFPTPFLDWYYIAPLLTVGGLLVVDDTQLWTGRILRDFLAAEPVWELVAEMHPRTAVFRKLAHGVHDREWHSQPFVARLTRKLGRWRRLQKLLRRLRGVGRRGVA